MFKGTSRAMMVALLMPVVSLANNLVLNGSFSLVNGATSSYAIDASDLPDWSASPSPNKFLDCVIFPGDTTNLCGGTTTNNPSGWVLSFYVNPGASPDGGNFVGIDGASSYAVPLTQTINNLVVGTSYRLFFYQASGQQSGFSGSTTEQWGVCLTNATCTTANATYSTLMNTPYASSVPWMPQTMVFKATSTQEVLTFLAMGTPSGQPPFVFLDGVSLQATPEPSTCGLIVLAGLAFAIGHPIRRRIASRSGAQSSSRSRGSKS